MARRVTRREFLAFAGALVGAGAALGAAALVGRPPTTVPAPAARAVHRSNAGATGPAPAPPASGDPVTGPTAVPVATLPVICRDAWGARAVRGDLVPHSIDRLTVHHTAVRLDANSLAPSRARGHQAYHQDAGWPDLAYHYLVDARGHVYEGRPVSARGDTFTSYDPAGHFLVCCEGNFDEQDVPAAQFDALAALLAWASGEFAVAPETIAGHRDYAATTCPGDRLAATLEDGSLLARVEQLTGGGGVAIERVCGTAGADLVASIEAGTDLAYDPAPSAFHLRYRNAPGVADATIPFGESDWIPVAGDAGR